MSNRSSEETAKAYNAMASQYRDSTLLPIRVCVDHHTLFRLAGPLEGKRVLDLACGEGHYTRLLKEAGAAEVLGVDISEAMLELAEASERRTPLGCRFQLADVAELALAESFDLVVGVYLLNYAADKQQLGALCHAIARHLSPGGRFIGLNSNMGLDPRRYGDYQKYGLRLSSAPDRLEGDPITVEFTNPDGSKVACENYYLSPRRYEEAFLEAGLKDFSWVDPAVSPEGLQAFPEGYWDALLAAPPTIALQARK